MRALALVVILVLGASSAVAEESVPAAAPNADPAAAPVAAPAPPPGAEAAPTDAPPPALPPPAVTAPPPAAAAPPPPALPPPALPPPAAPAAPTAEAPPPALPPPAAPAAPTAEAPPPSPPPPAAPVAPAPTAPAPAVAAEAPAAPAAPAAAEAPAAKPARDPSPYHLPFQLRPAAAANVLRLDNTMADTALGRSYASIALASYKLVPSVAVFTRFGGVGNAPRNGENGLSLVNPMLGATYGLSFAGSWKLALTLAATVPVGWGGGDEPEPATVAANQAGVLNRSAMDNALFAVNELAIVPGAGLAWVHGGFTVQVEATLLQLTRVRGEAVAPDESRTNFTSGLHVGYFFRPELSAGAELRYQRWLSTPVAVEQDEALRDNLGAALGLRAHVPLPGAWVARPGFSLGVGLHGPLADKEQRVVQLDVPVNF